MTKTLIPRGPVMADVAGTVLTDEERRRLRHPAVGGVILFRRNFESVEQLRALTEQIRSLRTPHLVIAVDHEGGRVQRFIDGFTRLPAMNVLGKLWDEKGEKFATDKAKAVGWVLATELVACGIDLSFTPVLDLDWGKNQVIGNRSFHRDPDIVSTLAMALQEGMLRAGMSSCGKHFPGHGFVGGDSHHVLPEDNRDLQTLLADDIKPFALLSLHQMAAIMPAHVVYPKVSNKPAGFSKEWLQDILRNKIGFKGVIFSDDLTMEGASGEGNIKARANSAFAAGCDIVLVCNRPDLVDELLENFKMPENAQLINRWHKLSINNAQIKQAALTIQTDYFEQAAQEVCVLSTPKDIENGVQVGEAF